jgi:TolA-binding protein
VGEKEEREAEALYKEGLSLMKEESFTEAIERFNEVIIAFPTSDYTEPCKKKIAEAKERLKEKETARRFEIAMNYYKLGDHREAIARLQQIIASTPEGTYTEKARTMLKHLAEQKEEESAAEIFRTAQDYYERREYDKAFSWFKKVVDLYPQTRYAKSSVVIMAQINERLSNQKAKRIYDEAKEFQFKGKYNEAIKRLDHLLSEYPNSYWAPYAQYTKAEVWYEMGEYQEALFSWQRMEEVFSDSDLIPHSLYHIADCLIRLKRNREAAETYAKLLLSYPDSIYAKGEIRALIEERIERLKE